jgi:hypothetical protein
MDDDEWYVVILTVPESLEDDETFWNEYDALVKLHCGVFDVNGKSHVTFISMEAARRFASSIEDMRRGCDGFSAMIAAF